MALSALIAPLERTNQPLPVHSSGPQITPSDRFYRPELDALRFFAFLSVFLHHGLPGFELSRHTGRLAFLFRFETLVRQSCSFGVCLFFLLSAYLITELLEKERGRTGSIHVRSFYIRRILRIWPLYFAFLFGAIVLGLFMHSYRIEPGRIFAFLFLSGNWYVAAVSCGASPIAPLWSISLEEQFYLAWPWVAKIGGRTSILGLSLMLLPISWLTLFFLARAAHVDRLIWVNSFVQFQFFALGALLALGLNGRMPKLRKWVRLGMILAGFLAWLTAQGVFVVKSDGPSSAAIPLIFGYTFVAIGCVLFFLGFLGMPYRGLPRPLAYLGKISYGLYVFHMLAIEGAWKALGSIGNTTFGSPSSALQAAIRSSMVLGTALVMTILLAMASYRFLEQPFLKLKERFTLVRSRRA